MIELDWYKKSIIYGVDISHFKDTDGDGIGDFQGLIEKLDYIQSAGFNCLWLLPFFPSPNRDNGYDVSDYLSVHPKLGTMEDFEELVYTCESKGINIIVDLVVHHTSNEHPWFRAAIRDKNSRFRNYYVWSEKKPEQNQPKSIFPGEESSVWSYNEKADSYYFHRFYSFQPDLNAKNPEVQDEIKLIMDFWLTFPINGYRFDAASHIFERKGLPGTELDKPDQYIKKLNHFVRTRRHAGILLAEADVEDNEIKQFFGDGEKFSMLFNFLLNNYLFYSLAIKSAEPLKNKLHYIINHCDKCQWANFIRNLDEVDLERLSEEERKKVMEAFAPDEKMRIYNRGVKRRFAPMMGGDMRRIKMTYSFLYSLPGSPVLVYGDEIGMGEDLDLKGRNSVRTAMQWNDGKNAGFTDADDTTVPVISDGDFSYKKVNVAAQENDPDSLLSIIRELAALRNKYMDLLVYNFLFVYNKQTEEVFVHRCQKDLKDIVILNNFSDKEIEVNIHEDLGGKKLLVQFDSDGRKNSLLESSKVVMTGYGFIWAELIS